MDDKKTVDDLQQIFTAGDAWLRKYGVITPIQHNAIVLNLYMIPRVKYVEYFMPPEGSDERWIKVSLHYPTWYLLLMTIFGRRDKLIDDTIDLLRDYLHGYDITVELKRYKGRKQNEIAA